MITVKNKIYVKSSCWGHPPNHEDVMCITIRSQDATNPKKLLRDMHYDENYPSKKSYT